MEVNPEKQNINTFVPEPAFDRDSLERRSELLYEITKRIWVV
jgi:hypothetical protein